MISCDNGIGSKRNTFLLMGGVWVLLLGVFNVGIVNVNGFAPVATSLTMRQRQPTVFFSVEKEEDAFSGVVELSDDEEEEKVVPQVTAPFLSQGELAEDVLNPDLSDPKQTRVIIYIIISLIPVLFLVPLMLGSRDLIPLDALPPVELN